MEFFLVSLWRLPRFRGVRGQVSRQDSFLARFLADFYILLLSPTSSINKVMVDDDEGGKLTGDVHCSRDIVASCNKNGYMSPAMYLNLPVKTTCIISASVCFMHYHKVWNS